MEDSDDEDNVQVIIFGNSTEANFDDFYREQDPTKDEQGGDGRGDPPDGAFPTGENEETSRDVDLETQVQRATRENRVFLKYDYTREKPWAHHADKSMWFNYNFDEHSFKEWVQKHIDRRIEKQQNYQIENADNIYEDKFRAVVRTPRSFEDTDRRGYSDHHELNYDDDVLRRNQKGANSSTAMKGSNSKKGALSNDNTAGTDNNSLFQPHEDSSFGFQPQSEEDNYMDGRRGKMPPEKASNRTGEMDQNGRTQGEGGHSVQGGDLTQFQNLVNFFKVNREV
ncbi:hypothetical protein C922_04939 [Plasmodium inui San Antonio 1]|uniref:Pre-mRNA polyadenylation factor Fip1 domain-containing protein n=1 Tax=Plasmodium inui San Antonio 1 TaxID=1237626 RepID=W6ZZI9_9APIC|nr:hypothetical protein C922_04939 [Plasmodium inui San Antonio 1]EUD64683.1 hypothetical protein C922_04939 [Plasmodium inui San Antonio 1]